MAPPKLRHSWVLHTLTQARQSCSQHSSERLSDVCVWGERERERLVLCRVVSEEVLAGTEIPGGGGRGRLHLTLHCHHHNDSCIKMCSDESHFNVSLTVRGKVTRQCPETTTFEARGVSWCFEPGQLHRVISGLVSWWFESSQPHRVISGLGSWCFESSQPHRVISGLGSWWFEPSQPNRVISGLVSWCFEPGQLHRVILGLVS